MNTAVISKPQEPEFSDEENKLAEKSVQRARTDIQWNAFWFEITCCYFWWLMPTPLKNWCIGLMFLTLCAAFWRWHLVAQNKFQYVPTPQKDWSQIIKGIGFRDRYYFPSVILTLSFLVLCLQNARDITDFIMYAAWICFSCFFAFKSWRLLASYRQWIVLNQDRLIIKHRYKCKGKKLEESAMEIHYSAIDRVESPGFRNLHIYYFHEEKHTYLPIEAQEYGVKGLAAILTAINKHAPQAQFDTEADLMRRGYFSW